MSKNKKVLEKVRKLMSLANDPSATEGEVENALKAAEALMAKYNIQSSDIEFSPLDINITMLTGKVRGEEGFNWIWNLSRVISRGYNCRCIGFKFYELTKNGNRVERRGCKIIGLQEDREVVKELVELTVPMVRNLFKRRWKELVKSGKPKPSEYIFTNSYIEGFLFGLDEKLQLQRKELFYLEPDNQKKYDLMVVKKEALIDEFIERTIKTKPSRAATITINQLGFSQGLSDGKSQTLSKQLMS